MFLAAVMAVMTDLNMSFFLVSIVAGIAAAHGVFGCTKRNDIYWAGLRTGMVARLVSIVYTVDHIGEPFAPKCIGAPVADF